MRTLAVGTLVLGMCGQSAFASPPPCGRTSLMEFADRFDQAQLRKNGPMLNQMVAENLVFITRSGERKGKREFIAGWTDPNNTYNPIVLSDRVTIPLGPAAAGVSAQTTLSGTSGDKGFASRIHFSDTFRCIEGEWRAVHIQVTRVPDLEH